VLEVVVSIVTLDYWPEVDVENAWVAIVAGALGELEVCCA